MNFYKLPDDYNIDSVDFPILPKISKLSIIAPETTFIKWLKKLSQIK